MASQITTSRTRHRGDGTYADAVAVTDATNHTTTALTSTGASDFVDVSDYGKVSIGVNNGAASSVVFTVEGSVDGTNFSTISYGSGSSAAYTQSALTVTASSKAILFLPPDDYIPYVRVNISSANATNGTSFTVTGRN